MTSFTRAFERELTHLAATVVSVLLLVSLASIHAVVEHSDRAATAATATAGDYVRRELVAPTDTTSRTSLIVSHAKIAASAVLITAALALLLGIRLYRRKVTPLLQRLEDSENRYRAIAELSVAGISITDRDMNIVFANPALEKMLDHPIGSLAGRNVAALVDEEQAARFRSLLAARIRGPDPGRYEATLVRRDGSLVICSISAAAMRDRADKYNGTLAIIMDISSQKQAEAELMRLKDAAETAGIAKDEFLANISHEFRSPLHIILGFARQARRRIEDPDPQRLDSHLARIIEGGNNLLDLVNELLDLCKLDARATQFNMAPGDMIELALAAINESEALVVDRGITLRLHRPGTAATATFDRQRLQQVMRNLIGNAIKFAPPGSAIEITVEHDSDSVQCSIADSGPGIPEHELDSIFGKFFQSSRTKTGAGGTGLGLAICREIVLAHGGAIRAENREGGGARFVFSLPAIPVAPTEISQQQPEPDLVSADTASG